jgi:hypothetical protein
MDAHIGAKDLDLQYMKAGISSHVTTENSIFAERHMLSRAPNIGRSAKIGSRQIQVLPRARRSANIGSRQSQTFLKMFEASCAARWLKPLDLHM